MNMANAEETVEDIVGELHNEPLAENGAKPWLHYLADRIKAASQREKSRTETMKPRRNCDRFANGDDAFYAFDGECKMKHIKSCRAGKAMCTGHDSIHCFKDWLFAPIEKERIEK